MAPSQDCCELLQWDSTFFHRLIGRILGTTLTECGVVDIERWVAGNRAECLYFLADPGDRRTLQIATEMRFDLTDIRTTLECSSRRTGSGTETSVVRPWRDGDVPALSRLAAASHYDSRFYYDGHFDRDQCDRLYATWIERSCHGYADAVLVADVRGEIVGYLSLHRRGASQGGIGLFAVAPAARGAGYGRALIESGLDWCNREGLHTVSVVTQGRNVRGLRQYERNGFVTTKVQLYYHWWPAADTGVPR